MGKHKKYMRDTRIYDELEDLELPVDVKYVYLYLSINHNMTVSGLYEISRRAIANATGVSRERIDGILQHLRNVGLSTYDNGLVFVPRISQEQTIEGKHNYLGQLRRMRSDHLGDKSEMAGEVNAAVKAFLEHHEQYFFEIDEGDRMKQEEDERLARGEPLDGVDPDDEESSGATDLEGGHGRDELERAIEQAKMRGGVGTPPGYSPPPKSPVSAGNDTLERAAEPEQEAEDVPEFTSQSGHSPPMEGRFRPSPAPSKHLGSTSPAPSEEPHEIPEKEQALDDGLHEKQENGQAAYTNNGI